MKLSITITLVLFTALVMQPIMSVAQTTHTESPQAGVDYFVYPSTEKAIQNVQYPYAYEGDLRYIYSNRRYRLGVGFTIAGIIFTLAGVGAGAAGLVLDAEEKKDTKDKLLKFDMSDPKAVANFSLITSGFSFAGVGLFGFIIPGAIIWAKSNEVKKNVEKKYQLPMLAPLRMNQ